MARSLHPKLPGAQGHHQASEDSDPNLAMGNHRVHSVWSHYILVSACSTAARGGGVTVHVLNMKTLTREMLSGSSGVENEYGKNGRSRRSLALFRLFRKG